MSLTALYPGLLLWLWRGLGGYVAAAGLYFELVAIDFDFQVMISAVCLHFVQRHFQQVHILGRLRQRFKPAFEIVAV
jgi:hypothetical protein